MSTLLTQDKSKTAPGCHDPPQYNSYHLDKDILATVVENEHSRRVFCQRMDSIGTQLHEFAEGVTTKPHAEFMDEFLEIGRVFLDGAEMFTELASIYRKCTYQNPELYTAISRLSDSEFDRAYTSLNRDSNRQIRRASSGDLHNRAFGYASQQSLEIKQKEGARNSADSSCSCDQLFGLSTKVDSMNNNTPGQSIQPQGTANILKREDALAKPHRSFWKRILSL